MAPPWPTHTHRSHHSFGTIRRETTPRGQSRGIDVCDDNGRRDARASPLGAPSADATARLGIYWGIFLVSEMCENQLCKRRKRTFAVSSFEGGKNTNRLPEALGRYLLNKPAEEERCLCCRRIHGRSYPCYDKIARNPGPFLQILLRAISTSLLWAT